MSSGTWGPKTLWKPQIVVPIRSSGQQGKAQAQAILFLAGCSGLYLKTPDQGTHYFILTDFCSHF